jgi:GNAT superfamily N-acetyltransferase
VDQLQIAPVESARARREFLSFPYRLYRDDPYWVPPLRTAQKELLCRDGHPFHRHATVQCFLATRSGRTVGRIAAILDPRYSEFHREAAGFFGFFDLIDDECVASELLGAARDWLRRHGAAIIRGPVNPSTNYECGVLVDGFDSCPRIMMTYNYPYYGRLLEKAGLRKAKDLLSYDVLAAEARDGRVNALLERATQDGMRIRPLRLKEFEHEVELAWDLYNSAWARNWGFVPMTREEFMHYAHEMRPILVPELALFAEIGDNLAGFALAVPDINEALKHIGGRLFPFGLPKLLWYQRQIRYMRVVLLGVRPEYRATPAAAALYALLIQQCLKLNYRGAECSWILEDNVLMRRAIESLGGTVTKTYRIYEW